MSATVDILGLERLQGRLVQVRAGALQKDLVDNLHQAAAPIRRDMSGAAFTRVQHRAMDSVNTSGTGDGILVTGGRGGGLGAVLFPGGEFGGRKSKKVTYVTRSRTGTAYSVRRRTTMQFLPHLGREGYFFWPTVREWLPKLVRQSTEIVSKALT